MQWAARQPASGVSGRCVIRTFVAPLKEGVLQLDEPFHLSDVGQCPLPLLACVCSYVNSPCHLDIAVGRVSLCVAKYALRKRRQHVFPPVGVCQLERPEQDELQPQMEIEMEFLPKNAIAITSVWERA
jgi:hypothetical protein